jgi:RHS repeat-associated protein
LGSPGQNPVETVIRTFPDGAIAAYTASGLAYYRHPDWLGSSRLASTPGRTIYSDVAYAPFGEAYSQTGSTDLSFTGQNQDTISGLYDFLYREQSPTQGRWISPDPAGLFAVDLTDPQSWNRYAYVQDRSLLFVDPLGLCTPGAICVVTNCQNSPQYCVNPGGGGGGGQNHKTQQLGSEPGAGSPQLKCAIEAAQGASPAAALGVQNVPIVSDLLGNSAADAAELALNLYDAANGSFTAFKSAGASLLQGQIKDSLTTTFTAAAVFRNKVIAKSINKGFSPRTNLTKQFAKTAGKAKIAADAIVFIGAYLYSCAPLGD